MGSVNRDFVFRELQAGKQTHNSHMDAHTDIHAREERKQRIWQVSYCTGDTQKSTRAEAACARKFSLGYSDEVNAIWQTVLQKYRRIPHVYIAGDFLIICTLSPSLLLSTPPTTALASSLASCTACWRSDDRPVLLASLSLG